MYLYRLKRNAPSRTYSLIKLSEINHNYLINSLSAVGSRIFVADTFNSVSMFQLNGAKMSILAKCYTPNWSVAMNALGERASVGADVCFSPFDYSKGLLTVAYRVIVTFSRTESPKRMIRHSWKEMGFIILERW